MFRRLLLILALASTLAAQSPPVFRITPVRPVEELRREALAAQPPVEHGDFRKPDLVELITRDPTIKLDIRYATADNFLSTPMYSQARAFMQRPAAEAVVRANHELHKLGYGLLIHDAYRPWYVTRMFWDATPADKHQFVADPATGSRHNRGCAVDLTLYELKTGRTVEMPSLYDEMSERADPTYKGGTDDQRRLRNLLRSEMEKQGFTVYEFEWWHFDYKDFAKYPIMNVPFEKLGNQTVSVDSRAETADIDGIVVLIAEVDEEGKVSNVRVSKSLRKDLDKRPIEAVKAWHFQPAMKDGNPERVRIAVEVKFKKVDAPPGV